MKEASPLTNGIFAIDYAVLIPGFAGYTLCSLLTVTAISVDRLLALLLGLRYRQVVSFKRKYIFKGYVTHSYSYLFCHHNLCLYSKSFFSMRHNQTGVQSHVVQAQPRQAIPLNIARYKKTVNCSM